jgi:hypothetical protein
LIETSIYHIKAPLNPGILILNPEVLIGGKMKMEGLAALPFGQ